MLDSSRVPRIAITRIGTESLSVAEGKVVAIYYTLKNVAGEVVDTNKGNGGKPLAFFGLLSIPLPVAKDHDAHELWEEVHEAGWMAITALVAVHVLAALYHHFVLKNDVLNRMTVGAAADKI